ncbi:peptidase S8/S53 subtilisin kexin sedolisin, partial [Pseudomonas sp. FW305-BF6]|uniref:S8 family serine peptidase n=1 Tax=Pseudomonas sp. FW305-BF6 TaxID=2070673 RepID=UPI000CAE9EB9
AYNNGILLVAAAGNNGFKGGTDNVLYPGKYSSLITVSAIDNSNQHPYFSSYGPSVDVSAPGVDVRSLYLNNNYEKLSGTSMA